VAHEINNPINGIMNYAQLIQDRLGEDNRALKEFTGEIMRETDRVAAIVRNLLTFARQDPSHHSPAVMVDIAESVLSLIRTIVRRDNITLHVDVPEDLPKVRCRSQQIQQVLMNLMTNARDALNERYAAGDDDKIILLTSHIHVENGGRWIRTTVEDHGKGMSTQARERIFDPFFTSKSVGNGTGLGLSISHGIVTEHGGRLTVESEPGHHTRFHMDLPLEE
jgi:signal transduction histidine kinase